MMKAMAAVATPEVDFGDHFLVLLKFWRMVRLGVVVGFVAELVRKLGFCVGAGKLGG